MHFFVVINSLVLLVLKTSSLKQLRKVTKTLSVNSVVLRAVGKWEKFKDINWLVVLCDRGLCLQLVF